MLIKCAILLEWVDIFVPRGERNSFTWAAWSTCFFFVSFSIIIFSLDAANCTPFEGNWNLLVPGRYCRFQVPQFVLAISIINFVLDLIPLGLVQRVIWGLHLPWHKKLGVSFMFLTGLAYVEKNPFTGWTRMLTMTYSAASANGVRIYYATRFFLSNDVSYYYSILAISSLAETLAANMVLCIPFVPKALLGLKQTKAFTLLKGYMTVKGDTTAVTNQSNEYYSSSELRHIRKPREHWFMSSKLDTNTKMNATVSDSVEESESQRGLRDSVN